VTEGAQGRRNAFALLMGAPMSDDRAEARRRAGKRLLGGALMACGGMIALLCGTCTVISSFVLWSLRHWVGLLMTPLILGGIPTAVGAILFWIGLRLWREGGAPPGKPWKEFE